MGSSSPCWATSRHTEVLSSTMVEAVRPVESVTAKTVRSRQARACRWEHLQSGLIFAQQSLHEAHAQLQLSSEAALTRAAEDSRQQHQQLQRQEADLLEMRQALESAQQQIAALGHQVLASQAQLQAVEASHAAELRSVADVHTAHLTAVKEQHHREVLASQQALLAANERHAQELLAVRQQHAGELLAAEATRTSLWSSELNSLQLELDQEVAARDAELDRTHVLLKQTAAEADRLTSEVARLQTALNRQSRTFAGTTSRMQHRLQDSEGRVRQLQAQLHHQAERLEAAAQELQEKRIFQMRARQTLDCQEDKLATAKKQLEVQEQMVKECRLRACVPYVSAPAAGQQTQRATTDRQTRCDAVKQQLASNASWEMAGISGRAAGVLSSAYCLLGSNPIVDKLGKALCLVAHPDKGGSDVEQRCLLEVMRFVTPPA